MQDRRRSQWETQVLSLIESQDLLGLITGITSALEGEITGLNAEKLPNPALAAWTRTYCWKNG
jgi:hypothetical protein